MKYDTLRSVKYMLESMLQSERMVVELTSLMVTYRVARMTSHALSTHQQTMNDVMQHEVLLNIHTSHTEPRPISHSLLLRSDVIDMRYHACHNKVPCMWMSYRSMMKHRLDTVPRTYNV